MTQKTKTIAPHLLLQNFELESVKVGESLSLLPHGNPLRPRRLLPLAQDVRLHEPFPHLLLSRRVRDADLEVRQPELVEVHGLTAHARARPVNQCL